MVTSTVVSGFGVQFKTGDGASPEVFTAVAEVLSVGGPTINRDVIEATHTDSPDNYKEFLSGLTDGGEVTVTMNFLPGNTTQDESQGIMGDFLVQTLRNYQVVFPTSPAVTWTFAAFITAFEPDAPIDDRMTSTTTFKLSGKPTLT